MAESRVTGGERIAQIDNIIEGIMSKVARGVAKPSDYEMVLKLQHERDELIYDYQLQFQKRA